LSGDGTLFCGHDSGTFIIEKASVKKYIGKSGTWKFESFRSKGLLLQGNYYGISVLKRSTISGVSGIK
jgi:hypothetical protein